VRDLTLILPFYRNAGMLQEQQAIWRSYSPEARAHLHVIVVDDCSEKGRAERFVEETGIASLRVFRTLQKVRWNWLFSRNLGWQYATSEWCLWTDIDHVVPAETMQHLVTMDLDPLNVYRLNRIDAPHPWPYDLSECSIREQKRTHPNTWLMTRSMYDVIGGYDERLSGCYGTDGEFKDRVNNNARAIVLLTDVHIRYGREIIPDASTVGLTRKNDKKNDEDLKARRIARDKIKHWKPLRVTFPYEQVYASEAACCPS
jgi:hypothetical protein